jgi:hypothetical protein
MSTEGDDDDVRTYVLRFASTARRRLYVRATLLCKSSGKVDPLLWLGYAAMSRTTPPGT